MGNLSSIQLLDGTIQEIVDAGARAELETKAAKNNPVVTGSLSLGRKENTTVGSESIALGSNVEASGNQSYAEGNQTIANSRSQHVFGEFNIEDPASVISSARGTYVEIVGNGIADNARGNARTLDWNGNEHLSGDLVINYGTPNQTSVSSIASSAVNALPSSAKGAVNGVASLDSSGKVPSSQLPSYVDDVVEYATLSAFPLTGESGKIYIALDTNNTYRWSGSTYIELTTEIDLSSKADVNNPTFTGALSRGRKANTDVGTGSFAFGNDVRATGNYSFAEGQNTRATGSSSHAEGDYSIASAAGSHAEGSGTTAGNNNAHAEGSGSVATGAAAHAEGDNTEASGSESHAEGDSTVAQGSSSHAEGDHTIAVANASHVVGRYNIQDGYEDWVSGKLYHVGDKVQKEFPWSMVYLICKTENSDEEFDSSKWNYLNYDLNYVEIVGNGTDSNNRSNARTLDWDGNERLAGDLYVHANQNGSGGLKVLTTSDIPSIATIEETRAIITEYNERKSDDGGVVFEATFNLDGNDHPYFETVDTASDIAAAFKSGKNVIIHLPYDETGETTPADYDIHSDMYITLSGIQDDYIDIEDGNSAYEMGFYFGSITADGMGPNSDYANDINILENVRVIDNKIRIYINNGSLLA